MNDFKIQHHGYFHYKIKNGAIEYKQGWGKVRKRKFWEGHSVRDSSIEIGKEIDIESPVVLENKVVKKEDIKETTNQYLSELGPLKDWINKNHRKFDKINPNILCNRSVLRALCSERNGQFYDYHFKFRIKKDEVSNLIELHNATKCNPNEPSDATSLAFEKFVTHGFENEKTDNYDHREKIYSVLSLEVGNWKILFNAEIDGIMATSLYDEPTPTLQSNGVLCEMKLRSGKAKVLKKPVEPWRAKAWFLQCHLAKIDDVIVGHNPLKKSESLETHSAELTKVRLYKTEDLPKLARSTMKELEDDMARYLKTVLNYVKLIESQYGKSDFMVGIDKNNNLNRFIT